MSFRHTHITEFLYWANEDDSDMREFVSSLKANFSQVYPHYNDYGQLCWIVFFGKDGDNYSEEIEMPERMKNLEGIMKADVHIVSAWESDNPGGRQRTWTIKGRGEMTNEEYLISKESNG